MEGLRNCQIQNKKQAGTHDSPCNPLPEADEGISGIWIFRQQRPAGKSHPHKPLYTKDLSGCHDQAYAERHAQLLQADGLGQIKPPYHMMEPNRFVLVPVLEKQDRAAEQVSCQRKKPTAEQSLSDDRIAR